MSQTKAELVNGLSVNAAAADAITVDSGGRIIQRYSAAPYNDRALTLQSPSGQTTTGLAIVNTETNGQSLITFGDHVGQNAGNSTGFINYHHQTNHMGFATNGGTERMRIDSSGKVSIGSTGYAGSGDDPILYLRSTSGRQMKIHSTADGTCGIQLSNNQTGEGDDAGFQIAVLSNADGFINMPHSRAIRFATANTERMRILSDGKVVIGGTSNAEQQSITLAPNLDDGAGRISFNRANTSNVSIVIQMQNNGSQVGRIEHDNTSCGIFSGSDYRLKENVVSVSDGITRLKTLKPSRFNFKVDTEKTVDGFLAHEVSSIVPEAITGTKDQVDSDGNPEYQAIDQSKLVPLLTAALQEEIGKREALETRVATLEAA